LSHGTRRWYRVEALVAFFPHFLAQFQFGVGFTFVTQTVFTLSTGGLEALLFAAAAGPANTRTGIAFKSTRPPGQTMPAAMAIVELCAE
jgi:hypothetical protein